jgi:hypothetical protein
LFYFYLNAHACVSRTTETPNFVFSTPRCFKIANPKNFAGFLILNFTLASAAASRFFYATGRNTYEIRGANIRVADINNISAQFTSFHDA